MCIKDTMRELAHESVFDPSGYVRMDRHDFTELHSAVTTFSDLAELIEDDVDTLTGAAKDLGDDIKRIDKRLTDIERLVGANEAKMPEAFGPAFADIFTSIREALESAVENKDGMVKHASEIVSRVLATGISEV